jgi:phage shock protein E
MDNGQYTIIDVREPFEFAMGHVENAINIPSESLMSGAPEMANVPKNANIIVYCKTGSRSGLAIQIFKQMGFTNLINGINKETVKQKYHL